MTRPADGRAHAAHARRLANFRANRRGYWSLWIFLVLFGCRCSPSSSPTTGRSWSATTAPSTSRSSDYPETTFGGDFETEADYRDPYVQELISEKGWMVWPPIPFSHDTIDLRLCPAGAVAAHRRDNWLGTDDQGRDVLARLIYGFRISVLFGLTLTLISLGHRRRRRRGAGLFRRLDRSAVPALHRDLVAACRCSTC